MRGRKSQTLLVLFVLSVGLLSSSLTAVLVSNQGQRSQFEMLSSICQSIAEKQPEAEPAVLEALKAYQIGQAACSEDDMLSAYGYDQSDFSKSTRQSLVLLVAVGFMAGGMLFLAAFWYWRRKQVLRIEGLTDYLEQVNTGNLGLLSPEEDDFSKLQDELYKTVTMLYQTREAAVEAKLNFAENLSNIAHQIKTPITAISLSAQTMSEDRTEACREQIQRQLKRLTHLEEALLLLARLDAGTLSLKLKPVDVFTVLSLAADHLQEVGSSVGVLIQIQEMGEVTMMADLEWTMEAIMNLMKNSIEHTPSGGSVYGSYEQNPLYTQIRIWDEGNGFAQEDLPHLFERFYRGKYAKDGGIGIGLPLAKAIIEQEHGLLSVRNIPNMGACFEIRIYSH